MTQVPAVREETRGLPVRLDPGALDRMRQDLELLGDYVESVLERDVDWGTIPGVPQPFLWEPGADKVLAAFNCYPRPVVLKEGIDEEKWLITYIISAEVVSRQTGEVVATGIGVASTREGKYGARWVRNPQDYGYAPATLRKRADKKTGEVFYRIPNPDWGDLVHTLLQMAYKRAKVDAVQGLPGASSALRRLFQGRPQRTAAHPPFEDGEPLAAGAEESGKHTAVRGEEHPARPVPDTLNFTTFWAEMNRLGISREKVHEILGVRSVKEDWVEKGRTLAEARLLIFQRLGITPPEKGKLL